MLVLEPHRRIQAFHGAYDGGFKIPISGEERENYKGHFVPFDSVLEESALRYEGTAIRYPLRLEEHAAASRVKKTPTSLSLARQMFTDFIDKDLCEVLLFLRHLTEIELMEIADDGTSRVLGRAWIQDGDDAYAARSKLRNRDEESTHLRLAINIEKADGTRTTHNWLIGYFVEDYRNANQLLSTKLKRDIGDTMAQDKLTGSVALALPLSENGTPVTPFNGRLFTLLPLPIHTSFPLHINGIFALTSSRQNLRNAEDAAAGSREECVSFSLYVKIALTITMSLSRLLISWNHIIFNDFVSNAWAKMLTYLVTDSFTSTNLFEVWPVVTGTPDGDRGYWHGLPARLLEIAGQLPVWPVHSARDDGLVLRYAALSEVLVASGMDASLVAALRSCNVPIVVPPQPIVELVKESEKYKSRIAMPSNVYGYLLVSHSSSRRND